MSVINKMLQELDRRQGMSAPDGAIPPQQVRPVAAARRDREWFWRIIAALMLVTVGWVAWIAYHLQPRTLVTEQAFKAAEAGRRTPVPAATAPQPIIAPKPEPAPEPEKRATEPAADKPAAQPAETFKFAQSIETPIRELPSTPTPKAEQRVVAAVEAPRPAPSTSAPAPPVRSDAPQAKPHVDAPQTRVLPPPASVPARVEKRDRARTSAEKAEGEFRRAVALLNQGRVSEAEEGLVTALGADPSHESARQALVALYLEYRRIDDARRLLQEGLAINPGNAQFATVLARIFVERRDYATALDVLNGVRAAAQGNAEYHALQATVLQRLARHAEAADAFQAALRSAPHLGAAWVGLGISLESLGKRPEAADAFRRAVASGSLAEDARRYAEQRARQLQ